MSAARQRPSATKAAAGHDIGAPFSLVPFSWVYKRKEPAFRRNLMLNRGEKVKELKEQMKRREKQMISNIYSGK